MFGPCGGGLYDYLNGPVDFQEFQEYRPDFDYSYVALKIMKWKNARVILGENFVCRYGCIWNEIYDKIHINTDNDTDNKHHVEARDARNVFKGVNMYGLITPEGSHSSDALDYVTETYIILPSGTKLLDLVADGLIRFIENTSIYKMSFKVSIQFGSPDTEVGYIRTCPYTIHPMENEMGNCHYVTSCGWNGERTICVGCKNVQEEPTITYETDGTIVVSYKHLLYRD
jgi:hypothetical protein